MTVKILLDAVGSSTIGTAILETLEAGGCQLAWFNPIKWYSIGQIQLPHASEVADRGRTDWIHGRGGDRGSLVGPRAGPGALARHADPHRGPGVLPLQTGFARNWQQTTGELVSGPDYFPAPEPAGRVPLHTLLSSPAMGASAARTLYYFAIVCAQRTIHIANPYFVPDASPSTRSSMRCGAACA